MLVRSAREANATPGARGVRTCTTYSAMRRRYPSPSGAIRTDRVNGHEGRFGPGHGGNPFGMSSDFDLQHVRLHGHDLAYRRAGDGETILLIHGMAGSSRAWK